ncbi:protein TIME FOR COFFEE isoform X2 [Carex littledalei]|uniref:Protein TIME FOR COFFEE isoform X2 n=1 Tax=Carex littledalei TaxID=544730 RepID=A0A833R0I2_9POAL|nr:protein TIME FOR COFFEE isoform X2 [Carex littledalei]
MERIREARRGSAMALNNGISRRRPRSGGSRDSPDEDGTLEMPESTTTRLRDRVSKRDRDRERERLSRGKRRRDSMALHGGRDEGDDSSDESVDEDEDDEEDDDMSVPSRSHNPSTSSVSQGTNHHHNHQNHHLNHGNNNQNYNSHHQQQQRKSLLRLPARWRADEMIGVPVPRKARTACRKRTSNEWFETAQRQASASPSRMSPASTSQQISPSGSNAAIRKKIQKSMNGPKQPRPPPPKVSNSKQSFFIQEEIEVAEVLFGLTRQFKQEKQEQKESAESKSRASSPQQTLPLPPESNLNSSSLPIIAPKRKRPRNLKEDETPASVSSTSKPDKSMLEIKVRLEAPSPKREKNPESPAVKNGFQTQAPALPVELSHERDLKVDLSVHEPKPSTGGESDRLNRLESREESFFPQKEPVGSVSNHRGEEASKKTDLPSDGTREHNFSIDLMAPPPGKLSPERDGFFNSDADQKAQGPEVEMESKANTEKKEDEKPTQVDQEHRKSEKTNLAECSSKKLMGKDRGLDLQLDLEKPKIESLSSSKSDSQQPKATKVEIRQDKAVPPSTMPMPMAVGGWPGNMPPFGFMSQVPPMPAGLVPVSGNPGSSNNLQPRSLLPSPIQRPKRCATHFYIAQLIGYHQRFAKMNPFWPPGAAAAAATSPAIYGARPFNMGMVPPSEAALLGSQVPGNFPGRNLGSMPDAKGAPPNLVPKFPGNHSEEKAPPANSLATESAQRKQQVVLQQQPQSGPMGNMMPAPAFIFPLNQQQAQAAVAAAAVAAHNRGGTMPPGASSSSSTTSANAGPAATMNLSFAGLPPADAQFLTILQNGPYPFPVPGHNGAPPSYRGAAPGQAMPFFNGPFYPPQMPHPSQLQAPPHQQQALSAGPQQQTVHPQQQGQKTGVSSSSSSSQKNQQPHTQELSGFSDNRSHLLGTQSRPQDGSDKGSDSRFIAQDNRMPPSQKGFYGHNFSLPVHPQNFAYMSSAGSSAALNSGNANHSEKQSVDHPQQPHPQARNHNARIDLASSQPFAMPPFGAFPGPGGAPVGLDFSSMVNNHHIFQNHPDGARHGYPHMGSAPNAAVASQHQKAHNPADSKSASGDSTSRIVAAEEERKNMAPSVKFPSGETQHPLSFSKKENEHSGQPMSNTNAGDNSSRTLNLIQGYREGHGSGNRSANTTPALTTASAATIPPSMSQQMLLQLQKHHQQQQQQQQQQVQHHVMQQQQQQQLANSRPKSAAPSMTSFPSTLMTFPQGLMQGGGSSNSPGQSPQWKSSSNSRAGTPAPSGVQAPSPATQAGTKNNSHHLHQQSRNMQNMQHMQNMQNMQNMQQSLPFSTHQTQISFGSAHSLKTAPTGPNQQGAPTDLSRSLAAAMAGASPSPSASKNSTSSSPPSISVSKPGPTASSTLTPPQQHSRKNSPSSSSNKAPPSQNHHNAPSILGHPSMAATNHSSMKSHNQSQQQQQHQQHQHQLKQQSFGQPQLFFSNPYAAQQGQSHANAAAAAAAAVSYHQKRQSDKTPQQQNPSAGPTVLRMPAPGLLHAAHSAAAAQSAAGGAHQRIPGSFYMPVAPVSVSKPSSDQKPASDCYCSELVDARMIWDARGREIESDEPGEIVLSR